MQRITLVLVEIRGFVAGACAFDAMSGVQSRAATIKIFSRFIIFIKSSGLFCFVSCATDCASVRIVECVLEQGR